MRERGCCGVPERRRPPGRLAACAARRCAHARGGARVGVGELLAAHRALAAVDAAPREEAFYALRAALCSSRADLAVVRRARSRSSSPRPTSRATTRSTQLGRDRARGAAAASAIPRRGAETQADDRVEPVPAAWSEEELLREQGLRRLHRRRARDRAAAARAARARARRSASRAARVPTRRRREVHDLRATIRALAAPRRRVRRAPLPRAGAAPAPARAGVRRLRLDGAVRADAAAVPAGLRGGARRASRRSCSARG